MLSPLRSPLSRRIALIAFVIIVAAEAAVLVAIPSERDNFVTQIALPAGLVALVAALAIALVANRLIIAPLLVIREAIRNPEGAGRMPVGRQDEIGGLARTIARGRERHEKLITHQMADLSRRETELRVTLEAMDQGVALWDADLKLVSWNSRMRELLGLPDEFFDHEHTFADYLRYVGARGEFGGADIEEEIQKRLATLGQKHSYERTRPDGTVLEIARNPIPSGGFIAIFTDITKRKQAEIELRATLENMDQGVAMYDADYKMVTWNSRMRELLDLPDEFFDHEHSFADYLRYVGARGEFGDVDVEEEVQRRLATLGRKANYERVRTDGSVVEITRNPIPSGGFIAIYTDISVRKKAEIELTNAKQAAGGGQSHQIRLPRQYEPRIAHAAQRNNRLQPDAAGRGGR